MEEIQPEAFVDYASKFQIAEEFATSIINAVLHDGGLRLYERYLERKAFPFAAGHNNEAVASRVKMCFVAHEDAEDTSEGWSIEEEPEPCAIDAWARNYLEIRRPKMDSTFVSTASKDSEQHPRRIGNSRANRNSDAKVRKTPAVSKPTWSSEDPRAFSINMQGPVDEEEEKFRAVKAAEDARKVEMEVKARAEQKKNLEERQRIEAMHEEMERRKHTFDLNGNIIWVDDVKPEKLPRMQEVLPYGLKKDRFARSGGLEGAGTTKMEGTAASKSGTGKKKGATSRSRKNRSKDSQQDKQEKYPDSFTKLKHAQPPILETMNMVPGVRLEFEGKEKNGPENMKPAGHMSRKDYIYMTEYAAEPGELPSIDENSPSAAGAGSAKGGALTIATEEEPVASVGAPSAQEPAEGATPAANGTGDKQPPAGKKQRPPPAGSSEPLGKSADTAHGAEDEEKLLLQAPVAPPYQTRARKFEALGYVARPPRFHAAPLGGPTNARSAQPPLGATMGHGLLRGKPNKDDYYFPDEPGEQSEVGMRRARSESSVLQNAGRAVLSRTPSQAGTPSMSPTSAAGMSPSHRSDRSVLGENSGFDDGLHKGRIVADRNASAYRQARTALFPNAGVPGGSRQGGSRQGGMRQGVPGSRQGARQ